MAPSTASPPPPTLPTSSTPGERARKLRDVYSRALKNALKPVSDYSNFAACFPTPAKYCENALRELHSDFVRKLGATCESEFDALLQEREVVKSLNELDALVEEAKRRREKSAQGESGDGTAYVLVALRWLLSGSAYVVQSTSIKTRTATSTAPAAIHERANGWSAKSPRVCSSW